MSSSTVEEKGPRRGCSLGLLLLVVGGLLVLCCGGGIALFSFGMGLVSSEVQGELEEHPVMQEHIGRIRRFDIDWTASLEVEGDDTFVWIVEGDKGSGTLTATSVTRADGSEDVVAARLDLPNGNSIDLDLP